MITLLIRSTIGLVPLIVGNFGFFNVMRWLVVGFTAVLLLPSVGRQQYVPAACLIAAIIILLPLTKAWFEQKVPSLRSRVARSGLWFGLVLMAMLTTPSQPRKLAEAGVRSQPNSIVPSAVKRESTLDLFQRRMQDYVSLPDLKERLAAEVKLDGKAIAVNKTTKTMTPQLLDLLPQSVIPSHPQDVKFIVWLEYSTRQVGRYTDGAKGFQQSCTVTLIDKLSQTLLAQKTFTGSMPPASKRKYSGNQTGSSPDPHIKRYLASLVQ